MDWAIGILIDVILLAVVIICIAKGKKDGFAKTLVSFLSFFIALIVATAVCSPASEFIYSSALQKPVTTAVTETVQSVMDQSSGSGLGVETLVSATEAAIDKLPGFVKGAINAEDIKAQITDKAQSLVNVPTAESIALEVEEKVLRPSILSLLAGILFVVVFVLVLIICAILARSLKLVNKIPLLGKVNEFLGGLIGALKGIVLVLIINWALLLIVGENGSIFSVVTLNTLNSSLINKTLIEVNPLNMVFEKLLS